MLRTLETTHTGSIDKVLSLLQVTTTDSTTPDRAAIVTIRLQNVLLVLIIRIDSTANITNRNGKDTLPSCALRAGIRPGIRDSVLSARLGSVSGVVITSDVVGVKRGVDDILLSLEQLNMTRYWEFTSTVTPLY